MNNQEVWKDVKNYEGIYKVSHLAYEKALKELTIKPTFIK